MFPGLPNVCKSAAKTPINAPTQMIPHRVAKTFFDIIDSYPPVVEFVRQIFRQFSADLIARQTVLTQHRYVKLEVPIVDEKFIGKTYRRFQVD
jgi:hypothetical protein